ncbi:MAG TPA: redoxin domain-containing protein, partial [Myxococcota bacterium]|nr:redoxin domain-containing protein [Myxococcota bacterium]
SLYSLSQELSMNLHLPLLLLLSACTVEGGKESSPPQTEDSTPDPQSDEDGDGLVAEFEALVGTSTTSVDTDADGCSDAVEILGYFDPLNPADRPYTGAYPRGPRPDQETLDAIIATSGEAFAKGSLNPNWTLTDQHGQEIELRDFFGQLVVVDLASEWCEPCQEATPYWESFYQEHKEEGVVVIQILLEGQVNNSEPVATRWAENYGVSFPVLVDHSPGDYTVTEVAQYYLDVEGLAYDIPNASAIDRQQIIRDLYHIQLSPTDAVVESLLAEPVPTVQVALPDNAEELRAQLGFTPGSWITPPGLCTTGG